MFALFYNLIRLIARKGLPKGMMLTMGDNSIIVVPVSTGAPLCPILINIGWDFVLMIPLLKKILQRRLRQQIEAFIVWNKKFTSSAHITHKEVLTKFMNKTEFRHALEIKPEHINEYCKTQRTRYAEIYTRRSLEMFVLFSTRLIIRPENAKLKLLMKHSGGRKLEIDRIKQVKKLRREGINGTIPSFPSISRMLKINVSLAHRWAHYPDELLLKKELEYLKTETK